MRIGLWGTEKLPDIGSKAPCFGSTIEAFKTMFDSPVQPSRKSSFAAVWGPAESPSTARPLTFPPSSSTEAETAFSSFSKVNEVCTSGGAPGCDACPFCADFCLLEECRRCAAKRALVGGELRLLCCECCQCRASFRSACGGGLPCSLSLTDGVTQQECKGCPYRPPEQLLLLRAKASAALSFDASCRGKDLKNGELALKRGSKLEGDCRGCIFEPRGSAMPQTVNPHSQREKSSPPQKKEETPTSAVCSDESADATPTEKCLSLCTQVRKNGKATSKTSSFQDRGGRNADSNSLQTTQIAAGNPAQLDEVHDRKSSFIQQKQIQRRRNCLNGRNGLNGDSFPCSCADCCKSCRFQKGENCLVLETLKRADALSLRHKAQFAVRGDSAFSSEIPTGFGRLSVDSRSEMDLPQSCADIGGEDNYGFAEEECRKKVVSVDPSVGLHCKHSLGCCRVSCLANCDLNPPPIRGLECRPLCKSATEDLSCSASAFSERRKVAGKALSAVDKPSRSASTARSVMAAFFDWASSALWGASGALSEGMRSRSVSSAEGRASAEFGGATLDFCNLCGESPPTSTSTMETPRDSCFPRVFVGREADFTRCQVLRQLQLGRVLIAAEGKLFCINGMLGEHPGGDACLLKKAGQDCSRDLKLHSQCAQCAWRRLFCGRLRECEGWTSFKESLLSEWRLALAECAAQAEYRRMQVSQRLQTLRHQGVELLAKRLHEQRSRVNFSS